MRTKKVEAEDLGDYDMPADLDAKIEAMTEQSERDIAAMKAAAGEIRVNFRWDATHLDIVKKAAELQGMPYQAYIKDCIFRRAVDDLDKTQRVLASSVKKEWSSLVDAIHGVSGLSTSCEQVPWVVSEGSPPSPYASTVPPENAPNIQQTSRKRKAKK